MGDVSATEICTLCPTAVFKGPNARGSLIRHLRSKAKNDQPHDVLHQQLTTKRNPTGASAIELRRKRAERFRTTHSGRATAIKRFSKIKLMVKAELCKQHADIKPQMLPRPQTPDHDITNDNRYRLLEEFVGTFAGRRGKRFKWTEVDKVVLIIYHIISSDYCYFR